MRDKSNIGFSVTASVILAGLLFQAANAIELRIVMPRLLELCVCYWVLSSPARVGIIFAFSVGILISLIEGSPVGAASMGLSIVAYVCSIIFTPFDSLIGYRKRRLFFSYSAFRSHCSGWY